MTFALYTTDQTPNFGDNVVNDFVKTFEAGSMPDLEVAINAFLVVLRDEPNTVTYVREIDYQMAFKLVNPNMGDQVHFAILHYVVVSDQ